jgi:hypothetical protein
MKKFSQYLKESNNFWIPPDDANIDHEYAREYHNHFKHSHGNHFPTRDDFHDAVKGSPVVHIDAKKDTTIYGRSHTQSFDDLHNLIKSYRSYPKYRNEKTLTDLSDRIKNKQPTHLPIIMKHGDGKHSIFSGNTRADLAKQHHGFYKAIVVDLMKHSKLNKK